MTARPPKPPRAPPPPQRAVAAALLDARLPADHPVRRWVELTLPSYVQKERFARFCAENGDGRYSAAELKRAAGRHVGVSDRTARRWFGAADNKPCTWPAD